MVHIDSDNPAVTKKLQRLIEILEDHGAEFHSDLIIKCENNQFSMHGYHKIGKEQICISIPESCTIETNEIDFAVEDQKIKIKGFGTDFPDFHKEMSELIFDIYNLTDKYDEYCKYGFLQLYDHDADLYEYLNNGFERRIDEAEESGHSLSLHGFLAVRTFRIREKDGITGGRTKVLVPLIEYFNHHLLAASMTMLGKKGPLLDRRKVVFTSSPDKVDELFIKYSELDTRQLLCLESYTDPDPAFVRSIMLDFQIPDHFRMQVGSNTKKVSLDKIPESCLDLAFFMTGFIAKRDILMLNFLYIPRKNAPHALRRVLFAIFSCYELDDEQTMKVVEYAEHKIITLNEEFYKEALRRLEATEARSALPHLIENCEEMCNIQLRSIKDYHYYEKAKNYKA